MIQTALPAFGRRLLPVALLSASALVSACGYFGGPQTYLGTPPAAQPAPQVAAPAAPKERLIAAIERSGCLLTSENVGTILSNANLTRAELGPLTQQLAAEGRAEVPAAGTIRLLSNNCI